MSRILNEETRHLYYGLKIKDLSNYSIPARNFYQQTILHGWFFGYNSIIKDVPIIKEFLSLEIPFDDDDEYWLFFFADFPNSYIIEEVYPYLSNPISWVLSNEENLHCIYKKFNYSFLSTLIFEDYLKYLESLSVFKRKKYLKVLSSVLSTYNRNLNDCMEIIGRFPELKLSMINI